MISKLKLDTASKGLNCKYPERLYALNIILMETASKASEDVLQVEGVAIGTQNSCTKVV